MGLHVQLNDAHRNALALIRAGRWEQAHALVQDASDKFSCLIHAYLHRVEGDTANARYWYAEAGAAMPRNTLEEELERLCAIADSN